MNTGKLVFRTTDNAAEGDLQLVDAGLEQHNIAAAPPFGSRPVGRIRH